MRVQGIRLKFSAWHRWNERARIPWANEPGVYLLVLRVKSGEQCDPTDKRIIYIGETCATFARRWRQFNRSAFEGKRGHAGGITYRKEIHKPSGKLFVAACASLIEGDLHCSSFIRFLERKLLLDFVRMNGRLPKCNKE